MASNNLRIRSTTWLILSAAFNAVRSSSITFGFETVSSSHFNGYENIMESTIQMTLYWNAYNYQCILTPLSNGTRAPYFCDTSNLQQITECEVNSSSTLPPYGLQIDIFGGSEIDIDRIKIQKTDDKNTMNMLYDIDYFIIDSEAIDTISASTPNKNIFFQFTSNNVYFLNRSSQCTPKSISTSTYTITSPATKSSNDVSVIQIIKESIIITIVALIGFCLCLLVSKRQQIVIADLETKNSAVGPGEDRKTERDLVVELVDDVSLPSVITMDDGISTESHPSPPLPDRIEWFKSSPDTLKSCDLGQTQPTFTTNNGTYFESASDPSDGSFVYIDPDLQESEAADKGSMDNIAKLQMYRMFLVYLQRNYGLNQ